MRPELAAGGDVNALLGALAREAGRSWKGGLDFNVEFDPRQDLLYEGEDQDPRLGTAALALARAAARRSPSDPRPRLAAGAVHFAFRRFEPALRELEAAERLAPGEFWPALWRFRALGYLAMTAKDTSLLSRALARADELARAHEAHPSVHLLFAWRAELLTGFDLHEAALADLDETLRRRPDYGYAYSEKADIHTQRHELEPALEACEGLLRLYPGEGWVYAIRGRSWGKCGRGREALADLDRAVELGPPLGATFAWRGEARRRAGDLRGAFEDFARAARLEPKYPLTYLWRGAAELSRGRLAAAVRDLDRSIALDPRNLLAFAWRGEALIKLGRLAEGLRDLDAFHPSNPRDVWTGGEPAFRRDWEDLPRRFPRRALALAARGRWRLEDPSSRLDDALSDLEAAARRLPRSAWCRAWRAQARLRAGDARGAAADLDAAVRLSPDWSWARAWRGRALLALGSSARAERELSRALALEPASGEFYAWRAEARRALGRADDAAADLGRAEALGWRPGGRAPRRAPAPQEAAA